MPKRGGKQPGGGGREPAGQADALLLAALVAGRTQAEAAAVARVSETTVARRLADSGFRRRLDDLQQALIDEALAVTTTACVKAARKLESLIDSNDEAIALRAAQAVLDQAARLRETAALRKLAELEDRLDGKEAS